MFFCRLSRRANYRFEVSQGRDNFAGEQPDRTHEILLGDVADIEFAENAIEHSFACSRMNFFYYCLGRTNENQLRSSK